MLSLVTSWVFVAMLVFSGTARLYALVPLSVFTVVAALAEAYWKKDEISVHTLFSRLAAVVVVAMATLYTVAAKQLME